MSKHYLHNIYTIFAHYLHTAILGRFHDGELVDGVAAVLAGVRVEEDIAVNIFDIYATNIQIISAQVPSWTVLVSPASARVSYSRSTEASVGAQPLVPDPYEARTVAVRRSGLGAGEGGEGLFVTRDIARGEVVAFYNGVTSPRLNIIVRLLLKYLCLDKTASQVWSQGMLGQLCVQNIHQHQRGAR